MILLISNLVVRIYEIYQSTNQSFLILILFYLLFIIYMIYDWNCVCIEESFYTIPVKQCQFPPLADVVIPSSPRVQYRTVFLVVSTNVTFSRQQSLYQLISQYKLIIT